MSTQPVTHFSSADYAVFGSMLAASAAIGLFYGLGKRKKSVEEFLLGSRNMRVVPVSMSVLATFISAITLLGLPAEVYQYGTMYVIIGLSMILVMPATAYLYMPVFYQLKLTSAYQYLELRFNKMVRTLGSTFFSLHMLLYMGIVIYAPALALSQGISLWMAVLSTSIVCTFYTTVGGLKAVVWTDVVQITIVFLVMILIIVKGATDVGGMKNVWRISVEGERMEFFNFDTSLTTRHTVWSLFIGGYFTWLSALGCNQATVQRYLSLPSVEAAQRAIWLTLPTIMTIIMLSGLAGLVVYSKYHDCDPITIKRVTQADQLFPLFVMETLGNLPGIPGLFVSGIFSGALSTVSSGVNSLAAVTLEDLIKTYINPDLSEKWCSRVTKILALIYGIIAILLVVVARELGDVLQGALVVTGILGGPSVGLFSLGMFFPWSNSMGAAIGYLSSMVIVGWIGIGRFIEKPQVPKAPISVSGCWQYYINITERWDLNHTKISREVPFIYRISYMWYSCMGCFLCIAIGLMFSLITVCKKSKKTDEKLISPTAMTVYQLIRCRFHNKLRIPPRTNSIQPWTIQKGIQTEAI